MDDQWGAVRQCRHYLITEVDGWEVMKQLREKSVFTPEEEEQVQNVKDVSSYEREPRGGHLLDESRYNIIKRRVVIVRIAL